MHRQALQKKWVNIVHRNKECDIGNFSLHTRDCPTAVLLCPETGQDGKLRIRPVLTSEQGRTWTAKTCLCRSLVQIIVQNENVAAVRTVLLHLRLQKKYNSLTCHMKAINNCI